MSGTVSSTVSGTAVAEDAPTVPGGLSAGAHGRTAVMLPEAGGDRLERDLRRMALLQRRAALVRVRRRRGRAPLRA